MKSRDVVQSEKGQDHQRRAAIPKDDDKDKMVMWIW